MTEFKEIAHKTVAELFDMLKEKVAEIDSLKTQLSLQRERNRALENELTSSRNYGDELQNRINEALKLVDGSYYANTQLMRSVEKVLHGKKLLS